MIEYRSSIRCILIETIRGWDLLAKYTVAAWKTLFVLIQRKPAGYHL